MTRLNKVLEVMAKEQVDCVIIKDETTIRYVTGFSGDSSLVYLDRFKGSLITDGRFSGASRGISIGHISPEAAEGGPIAFVENGDIIELDMNNRTITLEISDEEFEARKANWQGFEPKVKTGYLARYSKLVTNASSGGVMKI